MFDLPAGDLLIADAYLKKDDFTAEIFSQYGKYFSVVIKLKHKQIIFGKHTEEVMTPLLDLQLTKSLKRLKASVNNT